MHDALKREYTAEEPLYAKVGMEVMFVVNVDQEAGIVNGARATLIGFWGRDGASDAHPFLANGSDRPDPIVQLRSGGRVVRVEPHAWKMRSNNGKLEGRLSGYPIRPAAAVTSHKSQGSTIRGKVELNISRNTIVEYGQAYVMLSRVTRGDNLYLLHFDPSAVMVDPIVKAMDANDYRLDSAAKGERETAVRATQVPLLLTQKRPSASAFKPLARSNDDARASLMETVALSHATTGQYRPWEQQNNKKRHRESRDSRRHRDQPPAPKRLRPDNTPRSAHTRPTLRFGLLPPTTGTVSRS
jgi:hypothetical protein